MSLSSKDLIKIRKNLIDTVGPEKATTMTARLARKVEENLAKRNKVTIGIESFRPDDDDLYEGFGLSAQSEHVFDIKKGGVPLARGSMDYTPNVGGHGAELTVHSIGKTQPDNILDLSQEASNKYKNTVLKPKDIKAALIEVKKRFPKAEYVVGSRATGAHAKAEDLLAARGVHTTAMQEIRLPNVKPGPSRLEKAMAHSSTRLRGAMRGVSLTAPLEAGLTSYATGGGLTGAAASAASTAGVGAGITAALRRAATAATKAAPILGRVGTKAMPALMVAGAAYDAGRTVYEGYNAYRAHADAKANELAMTNKYGTIEAATETRRRKKHERA